MPTNHNSPLINDCYLSRDPSHLGPLPVPVWPQQSLCRGQISFGELSHVQLGKGAMHLCRQPIASGVEVSMWTACDTHMNNSIPLNFLTTICNKERTKVVYRAVCKGRNFLCLIVKQICCLLNLRRCSKSFTNGPL